MKFWVFSGAGFGLAVLLIWVATSPTMRFTDVDVEEATCKYLGTDTEGVHHFNISASGTASGPPSVQVSAHVDPIDLPFYVRCTGWGAACFRDISEVKETSWRGELELGTAQASYPVELEVSTRGTGGSGRERVHGDRSREKVTCALPDEAVVAGVE